MLDYEKMRTRFLEFDMKLSRHEFNLFDIYAEFLVAYNEKVNLTAITSPREIAVKHFLDSVIPLCSVEMFDGITIADIGTGAGFPGLPMLIMHKTARLTLIESNGKRVMFLTELIGKLNAYNAENGLPPLYAEIVQARSEDCARQSTEYRVQNTDIASGGDNNPAKIIVKTRVLRESFDIATARAVAPLSQLAEYCIPFVKVGGIFLALKGTSEDYESGASAVEELGGDLEDYAEYTLPTGEGRRVFVIEKSSPTPKKYPRSNSMIKKKGL